MGLCCTPHVVSTDSGREVAPLRAMFKWYMFQCHVWSSYLGVAPPRIGPCRKEAADDGRLRLREKNSRLVTRIQESNPRQKRSEQGRINVAGHKSREYFAHQG
jgi:hypothetical protein